MDQVRAAQEVGCRPREAERGCAQRGERRGRQSANTGRGAAGSGVHGIRGGYAPDDDTGGTGPPAAAEAAAGSRWTFTRGKTTLSAEDARGSERAPRGAARSLVNQVSNRARAAAQEKRAGSQQHSRRRSERTIYVLSRDARSAAETAALERFISRKMRRLTRRTPTDSFQREERNTHHDKRRTNRTRPLRADEDDEVLRSHATRAADRRRYAPGRSSASSETSMRPRSR